MQGSRPKPVAEIGPTDVSRDAEFDFYQRTRAGVREQASRAKQGTDFTNRDLGEAVGKDSAQRYLPASSKQNVLEMVGRIKQAFRNDLDQRRLLDASTK